MALVEIENVEWNIKGWDSLGFLFRLNFHCIRHFVRDAFPLR
jgi:hypothetical protein